MPTTTITRTSLNTALAECADAVVAEDWPTARKKYAVAEIIYQGLESELSDAGTTQRWRDSLDNIKSAIDLAEAGSAKGEDSERRMVSTHMGWGG